MSEVGERDLERLFRSASFSNPAHKESLKSRLFEGGRELGFDDLAIVTGGVTTETVSDRSRYGPRKPAGD